MKDEIRTAISKAMGKLVGFSLNEKKMNGHSIQVSTHGRFNHDVWVAPTGGLIEMIKRPELLSDIPKFESEVEKVIAKLTVNFANTPAEILATLHSEVNE